MRDMPALVFVIMSWLPLTIMIVSDFKNRNVALLWLISFGILNITAMVLGNGLDRTILNTATNFLFLVIMYGSAWLYIRIARRKVLGSLSKAVGTGDLLFLPLMAVGFGLNDFVVFLLASFILSLAYWAIHRIITDKAVTIPLISTVGTCFIIYSFYKLLESV